MYFNDPTLTISRIKKTYKLFFKFIEIAGTTAESQKNGLTFLNLSCTIRKLHASDIPLNWCDLHHTSNTYISTINFQPDVDFCIHWNLAPAVCHTPKTERNIKPFKVKYIKKIHLYNNTYFWKFFNKKIHVFYKYL